MKNSLNHYKTNKGIRGTGYDGSIRKRPKGLDNKTVALHLNKENALRLLISLSKFIDNPNTKDIVYITAFKEQKTDEGMHITVTSPKEIAKEN